MTPALIAIDATALDALVSEVRALRQEIQAVRVSPQPEWFTVAEAAARLSVSTATIRRKVASGEYEAKGSGKGRLVRL